MDSLVSVPDRSQRRKPDVTIRPTVIDDTWKFLGEPYEGKCHHCGEQHGPDTKDSTTRWAKKHLSERHNIELVAGYETPSGTESW